MLLPDPGRVPMDSLLHGESGRAGAGARRGPRGPRGHEGLPPRSSLMTWSTGCLVAVHCFYHRSGRAPGASGPLRPAVGESSSQALSTSGEAAPAARPRFSLLERARLGPEDLLGPGAKRGARRDASVPCGHGLASLICLPHTVCRSGCLVRVLWACPHPGETILEVCRGSPAPAENGWVWPPLVPPGLRGVARCRPAPRGPWGGLVARAGRKRRRSLRSFLHLDLLVWRWRRGLCAELPPQLLCWGRAQ